MNLLTLAEIRDDIRRFYNGRCPSDSGDLSLVGQPFANQPHPSNQLINMCVQRAVSEVNRKVRWGSSVLTTAITLQTANGPLAVPLTQFQTQGGPQINIVRRAWWNDSVNNSVLLYPRSIDAIERDRIDWMDQAPGIPNLYWVEGYTLYLWPAPNLDGTLGVRAGMGLLAPLSDVDTVKECPADYLPVFEDIVMAEVCAAQPDDSVAQAKLAFFGPKADRGKIEIASLFNDLSAQQQAGIAYKSNRIWSPVPVRRY